MAWTHRFRDRSAARLAALDRPRHAGRVRQRPELRHPHHLAERDRAGHRGRRRRRRARRSGSRRQARQHPGHARRCAAGWRRRQRGGRSAQPAPRPGRGSTAAANAGQQRQLDFQRQSQLQQAQAEQQIEEQKLFEQWKQQRGSGVTPAAVTTQADLTDAQRLLTGARLLSRPDRRRLRRRHALGDHAVRVARRACRAPATSRRRWCSR